MPLLATVFGLFYQQELAGLAEMVESQKLLRTALQSGFSKAFAALLLMSGIVAWWLVLAHKSRQVAQHSRDIRACALSKKTESRKRKTQRWKGPALGEQPLRGSSPSTPKHRPLK